MAEEVSEKDSTESEESKLNIYVLPNLLTGANLFCGFVALTRIVEANLDAPGYSAVIRDALFFILLACIFDLLDGRVARMGGKESPFGQQFDSLADVVSFGVAPAFLVHRIVLRDVFEGNPRVAWFIASVYLLCGALRLARYNCLAARPGGGGGKEFLGFPIPAAAGLVASLTMFLLWWDEKGFVSNGWRHILPIILLFLSFMMVSEVKYPSFKSLDLRATRKFTRMVVVLMFVGLVLVLRDQIIPIMLPFLLTSYLIYGFVRPFMSRRMRREIEEEEDEGEDEES